MSEVQKFNPNDQKNWLPLTMTDAAFQYFLQHITKRGCGIGLKLSLKKSGCSGYKYVVDFIDTPTDDLCFPLQQNSQYAIYVAAADIAIIEGTEISLEQQGLNRVYVYRNPKQKGVCGCGESFSIENE